jgi:putative oxidoreductase
MMENAISWEPVPLRLMIGMGFVHHGFHKLFYAGEHWAFVTLLESAGVPAPDLVVWTVAGMEFAFGAAILLGAFVRALVLPLVAHMVGTMFLVHFRQGFDFMHFVGGVGPDGAGFGMPGYEVNLLYLAGLVTLLAIGAGEPSVDAWRARRPQRTARSPRRSQSPSSGSSATTSAATTTHVPIGRSPSGAKGVTPGSPSARA